ncbi:glycosyltransferase family 2 protein [Haloarcula sp. 1CSR25-25]|uniref:glycosyltransferase family 2 protein n=1 Tax=Haloarcula sp. 1CSR25-25 TaxID=2862545 RepID=UPI002895759A|nr:glycosyltransferase family 2 protein [Haloarcula sp. 1CSR25-25]MDT3435482.1 glycosyltransferase family 2 protein [Haloarcula sp. 1CSR25-25]
MKPKSSGNSHQDSENNQKRSTIAQKAYVETPSNLTTGETLIGIPAYNEGTTIRPVVEAAKRYASEVIVIDDGSTDNTVTEAIEAGATVVQHEINRGYGGALMSIFRIAQDKQVDQLVILDGDGQHDVSDVPKLVKKQKETEANIVIGSRFAGGKSGSIPLYRLIGLRLIALLVNIIFKHAYNMKAISDTQSGFRVYDKEAINSIAEESSIASDMGASVNILFHAANKGYEISEVATNINYNVIDANTHDPIRHGFMIISNLLEKLIKDKPKKILGLTGSLFVMFGSCAYVLILIAPSNVIEFPSIVNVLPVFVLSLFIISVILLK